jgi:hypothetical protein
MQNPNNLPYILEGGLGDFLQFLPFVKRFPQNRYMLLCHFKGAKELCKVLKIKMEQIEYYSSEAEKPAAIQRLKQKGLPCPRVRYFESNPFGSAKPLFKGNRPVVGVHLHASKIAQYWLKEHGHQPKNLPLQLVDDLVKDYDLILFGLPEDLAATKIKQTDHIKFVCFFDIAKSLSYVSQCDALVGSDSAFKTASAMSKIPTFVWIGDHDDIFRDRFFVEPYVQDGTMGEYRFHILADEYEQGLAATKKYLQENIKK